MWELEDMQIARWLAEPCGGSIRICPELTFYVHADLDPNLAFSEKNIQKIIITNFFLPGL